MIETTTRHQAAAALRFLDVNTGIPVNGPFLIETDAGMVTGNRRGLYVLLETGDATQAVVSGTHRAGTYLPTQVVVSLPRDADPDNADEEDSLFQPVDVPLYPSSLIRLLPGWSVLRVTVAEAGTDPANLLPGALIIASRTSDGEILARGLTDWRGRLVGEATVTVPGLPVTTWDDGEDDEDDDDDSPILINKIQLTVKAIFDPLRDMEGGELPDPDDLEERQDSLATASTGVMLASGQSLAVAIDVPLS